MEREKKENSLGVGGTGKRNWRKLKLDTKGCCFLCLKLVYFKPEKDTTKTEDGGDDCVEMGVVKQTVSLRFLQQYLGINMERLLGVKTKNKEPDLAVGGGCASGLSLKKEEAELEVDLCVSCDRLFKAFQESYLLMELLQMQINYNLERIQQQIEEASRRPELVQCYFERMASENLSGLMEHVFADDLRKEIIKKSSLKMAATEPRIRLTRFNDKTAKHCSSSVKPKPVQMLASSPILEPLPSEDSNSKPSEVKVTTKEDDKENFKDTEAQPLLPLPLRKKKPRRQVLSLSNKSKITRKESRSLPRTRSRRKKYSSSLKLNSLLKERNKNDMTVHQNQGSFSCGICWKRFNSSGSMKRHRESIHFGKRYKCEGCTVAFSFISNLVRHKKSCRNGGQAKGQDNRTGTRCRPVTVKNRVTINNINKVTKTKGGKYRCSICHKGFATNTTVRRHQAEVHNVAARKAYPCDLCGINFTRLFSLKVHKQKRHSR